MDSVDLSELFTVIKVYKVTDLKWLSSNISINNIWTVIHTQDGIRVMAGLWPVPLGYLVTLESWSQKHRHWEWPYDKLDHYAKEKTRA